MKLFGQAKSHFYNKYQRSPWNSSQLPDLFAANHWPTLENFLNDKRLTYFDFLLTQRLLRQAETLDESAAFFICHLIMAAKAGHLCVEVSDTSVMPAVSQLWNNEGNFTLTTEELTVIEEAIQQGAHQLPSFLVTLVPKTYLTEPETPICQWGDFFYLQKYWIYESLFLHHFNQHLQEKPAISIDYNQVKLDVEEMQEKGELNLEQAQSIVKACVHPITLITGGPGTGKSYTAGKLIHILYKNMRMDDCKNFQIVLAAPTGKAAANLQKSLPSEILTKFPSIQAKTLHSLLNIQRYQVSSTSLGLNADLIIIDESSMIDIQIMLKLFESLKKGSRIVLLGDSQQLSSIGAGNVFLELEKLTNKDLPISRTHLKTCLRAELKSIIEFAELVKNGCAEEALEMLKISSAGVCKLNLQANQNLAQKELIAYIAPFFPSFIDSITHFSEIFKIFNQLRLLSPVRKGLFGVDTLNQEIWKTLSQKKSQASWIAIPIMICANDIHQDLFNGDTGVLIRKLPLHGNEMNDFALFASRTNPNELRQFSTYLLPKYELAYCLSVHKSQGSEFDRVILVLPEGSENFGREIFYTAITRARKQIEIWSSDITLKKTILNREIRLSNIPARLTHFWENN